MPADSFDRTVTVTLDNTGYVLRIDDDTHRLSPGEAMSLLVSLLHEMPEVENGVNIAHQIRCGPRLVIEKHWTAHNNIIRQDRYRGVTLVRGHRVERTPPVTTPHEAQKIASRRYGKTLEITKTIEAPGSRLLALKRANEWVVKQLIEEHDMTVPQLFAAIQEGSVTPMEVLEQ